MIEALKDFPDNVAAFAYHGHVTKADYETVVIPDIEDKLTRHKRVRLYAQIAPDFTGIDPGAVWEDTKLGASHFLSWERAAVVTDVEWIKQTGKFFAFMMPGMLHVFPTDEAAKARDWVVKPPTVIYD